MHCLRWENQSCPPRKTNFYDNSLIHWHKHLRDACDQPNDFYIERKIAKNRVDHQSSHNQMMKKYKSLSKVNMKKTFDEKYKSSSHRRRIFHQQSIRTEENRDVEFWWQFVWTSDFECVISIVLCRALAIKHWMTEWHESFLFLLSIDICSETKINITSIPSIVKYSPLSYDCVIVERIKHGVRLHSYPASVENVNWKSRASSRVTIGRGSNNRLNRGSNRRSHWIDNCLEHTTSHREGCSVILRHSYACHKQTLMHGHCLISASKGSWLDRSLIIKMMKKIIRWLKVQKLPWGWVFFACLSWLFIFPQYYDSEKCTQSPALMCLIGSWHHYIAIDMSLEPIMKFTCMLPPENTNLLTNSRFFSSSRLVLVKSMESIHLEYIH